MVATKEQNEHVLDFDKINSHWVSFWFDTATEWKA